MRRVDGNVSTKGCHVIGNILVGVPVGEICRGGQGVDHEVWIDVLRVLDNDADAVGKFRISIFFSRFR